jgi:hypothetical protein
VVCPIRADSSTTDRLRKFHHSRVTHSSDIYARIDDSGDVTKQHHENPEVRASMLSRGAFHGHDGVQTVTCSGRLMTARSLSQHRDGFAAEFRQLTFWR